MDCAAAREHDRTNVGVVYANPGRMAAYLERLARRAAEAEGAST